MNIGWNVRLTAICDGDVGEAQEALLHRLVEDAMGAAVASLQLEGSVDGNRVVAMCSVSNPDVGSEF